MLWFKSLEVVESLRMFRFRAVCAASLLLMSCFHSGSFICAGESGSVPDEELDYFFEEIEGGPFILHRPKPEWSSENISTALNRLAVLCENLEKRPPYAEARKSFENALDFIPEETLENADIPEEVLKEFERIATVFQGKYFDELLKENGLCLNGTYPGLYWIHFDTVNTKSASIFSWSSKQRHLRFKIHEVGGEGRHSGQYYKEGMSDVDLTNVELVLLDKSGFELKRVPIGKIKKHGWATGEFEIDESMYKQIATTSLVTDQDR